MTSATVFGIPCELVAGFWISREAGLVARSGDEPRDFTYLAGARCPACRLPPSGENFDPCLGHIPGATAACCGHGAEPGSVTFASGIKLYLAQATTLYLPPRRRRPENPCRGFRKTETGATCTERSYEMYGMTRTILIVAGMLLATATPPVGADQCDDAVQECQEEAHDSLEACLEEALEEKGQCFADCNSGAGATGIPVCGSGALNTLPCNDGCILGCIATRQANADYCTMDYYNLTHECEWGVEIYLPWCAGDGDGAQGG